MAALMREENMLSAFLAVECPNVLIKAGLSKCIELL